MYYIMAISGPSLLIESTFKVEEYHKVNGIRMLQELAVIFMIVFYRLERCWR